MPYKQCGSFNTASVCIENVTKKQKNFPKQFIAEVKENINGYPFIQEEIILKL